MGGRGSNECEASSSDTARITSMRKSPTSISMASLTMFSAHPALISSRCIRRGKFERSRWRREIQKTAECENSDRTINLIVKQLNSRLISCRFADRLTCSKRNLRQSEGAESETSPRRFA